MIRAFPIRSESHQIEEISERFFRDSLPRNWTAEKPSNDYGVDLRVDMFELNQVTGLELLVQLKASSQLLPTSRRCGLRPQPITSSGRSFR